MVQLNRENFITAVLVVLMLLTGTINTIATKYQDIQCVKYNEKNECVQRFEHFAVQSAEMFMGEMLCLIPAILSVAYNFCFSRREVKSDAAGAAATSAQGSGLNRHLKALFSFAVPAMCDVSGTT